MNVDKLFDEMPGTKRAIYETRLNAQKNLFYSNMSKKPYLKILPGTESAPIPLCYDSRTEEEIMISIRVRMRKKLIINNRKYRFDDNRYIH